MKPKEWHIWDFPDNLYVLIRDEVRDEFFRKMYQKFSSQLNYAKFLGKDRNCIQGYHYARGWDNNIKHVKFMPLKILHKSLQFIEYPLKCKIENSILEIIAHGGKSIKNPILPIKECPALYRIVAHLIGDGNDSHTPYYANTCKELREQFKKDLQIFGNIEIYESTPNTTPCVNFPKVITRILGFTLDIPFTHPERLPQQIFETDKECKKAFLQAIYDDEGCISTSLSIGMNNKLLLNQIKQLIEEFDIKTNKVTMAPYFTKKGKKNMYRFQISPKTYVGFKNEINFMHPKKVINLNFAIATRERGLRTRPQEYIEEKIIEIISIQPSAALKLAHNLQFTISGIMPHLKKLYNEKIIVPKYQKNEIIWDLI